MVGRVKWACDLRLVICGLWFESGERVMGMGGDAVNEHSRCG